MKKPVAFAVVSATLLSVTTAFAIDPGKPTKGQLDHLKTICPKAGGSNQKLLACIVKRCETGKLEADTFEATNARADHQLKGARSSFRFCVVKAGPGLFDVGRPVAEAKVFEALKYLTNGKAALELAYGDGKGALRATKVSPFLDKFDVLVSEHGGCGGLVEMVYDSLLKTPIELIVGEIVAAARRISIPLPDARFASMCAKEFAKGFVCTIPDTIKGAKDIGKFLLNCLQELKVVAGPHAVCGAIAAAKKVDPAVACKVVGPISAFFRQVSACFKAMKSSEIWPLIASSVLGVGCNYLGGFLSGNILTVFSTAKGAKLAEVIMKKIGVVVQKTVGEQVAKWVPRIIDASGNITNPSYLMKLGRLEGKTLKIGRFSLKLNEKAGNIADAVAGIVQGEIGKLSECKGKP